MLSILTISHDKKGTRIEGDVLLIMEINQGSYHLLRVLNPIS